jgi:hypothetical protein
MTKIFHSQDVHNGNPIRGYIEGYYGRLLSWSERELILDQLHRLAMNHYLYAPKEDICHRYQWRQAYSDDWQKRFRVFCDHATRKNVTVIAGIAPGLDYDFGQVGKGEDWETLLEKCRLLLSLGADCVALLMDDIHPEFTAKSGSFIREGTAHAALANDLHAALSDDMHTPLILTPRLYADEVMSHDLMAKGNNDHFYWPDLAQDLNSDIALLVCGKYVVSPDTSLDDTAMAVEGIVADRTIIWDNLYAHDYCPRRLFLGKWTGRHPNQHILLNPTGLVKTDQLLLSFMAAGDDETAWRGALKNHGVPEDFHHVAPFFDLPPDPDKEDQIPALDDPDQALTALDGMLWQWKTPLAREWYPFLMGLRQDILLATGRIDHLRQQKSLPPLLNQQLRPPK